mmetsp:Transcript_19860/g.29844  ORF Transcript_19860/g.29844 Transcript_19860/m.29844 type:complete len:465 (-) Transcript_19860:183-1577(-)
MFSFTKLCTILVFLSSASAFGLRPTQSTLRQSYSSKDGLAASEISADLPRGGGKDETGGSATIPSTVFNLVKSIAGAGVLSLPAGIAAFGNAPSALVPATILIALMGGVSAYTFALIGRLCSQTNTESYSDAWDATVGAKWSPLIAFSCFIDCFAGNLSYSMILADTFTSLLESVGVAVTRTQSLFGVTGLVLLPLCLLKNLSSLALFSLVGIIGMLYTTLAMVLRYIGGSYNVGGEFANIVTAPSFGSSGAAAVFSPKSLILMCMLSNAYISHFIAPKMYNDLKDNTLPRFYQMTAWSFGTTVLLYSIISAAGFLTFGAASNGYILNNYAATDFIMSLSRIAIAISITASYPLLFVGTRDGLLDLFKLKERSNGLLNKVTLGILAVVTAMAAKLTDLGLVASVGGATFGTALVFIYPCLMFLKYHAKNGGKGNKETLLAKLIATLGVVMGAIGTSMALQGVDV